MPSELVCDNRAQVSDPEHATGLKEAGAGTHEKPDFEAELEGFKGRVGFVTEEQKEYVVIVVKRETKKRRERM